MLVDLQPSHAVVDNRGHNRGVVGLVQELGTLDHVREELLTGTSLTGRLIPALTFSFISGIVLRI